MAASRAASSVAPTKETSGCVKQAAGTDAWFKTWGRPHMFSTAEMPWADAACASMYLPVSWVEVERKGKKSGGGG